MKPAQLPRSPSEMQLKLWWRMLNLGFWLSVVAALPFVPIYAQRGQPLLAVVEAMAVGIMAVGYALAIARRQPLIGMQTVAVIDWLLLAVVITMHGGLRSPAVAWIIVLAPLLMLVGMRLALAMTALTVLLIAGLYVAERNEWLLPFREVPLGQRAASAMLISSFFAVFAWFALRWRTRLADELQAARDTAIEANQRKNRFIANLNHEIRTPMNALVAGAQLLGRDGMGGDQQPVVRAMQRAAEHLLALVNDVLDHARLEAGELRIEAIEFSLRDLAGGVVQMFSAQAESKPLALQLEVADGLHDLWIGDPMRLRQVLANLLSNAIKFTPAGGGVVLRVAGATASDGGSALSFEVQDNGPGIAAELQARLFRPYEQGDVAITRRFGGTGLGLAICKELLQLMRGAIEVESTPGAGTTFRVLVPLVHAKSPWHRPLSPRAAGRGSLPVHLRLLLVEDDEVNRLVMQNVLRELGVQVQVVASGEQALVLLEEGGVDLVLMDCQMSQQDGLSTTRQWRAREAALQRARVPVIALTGEVHDGARAACHAAGMDDYLIKPTSGAELHAMLVRWLPAAPDPPTA